MVDIVTRPDAVTNEWLTQALRDAGCLEQGAVEDFEYKVIGTGKMGDNARFTLSYQGDHGQAPESMIIKFPAEDETARMMAGAQGAYYNEVMFYRHLAGHTQMRTPAIYADSAYEILTRESRDFTGQAVLCEDVLKASGVTDFAPYAADGAGADLGVDLFVDSVDPA